MLKQITFIFDAFDGMKAYLDVRLHRIAHPQRVFCPLFKDSLPRSLHIIYSGLELDCPIPLPAAKRPPIRTAQPRAAQPPRRVPKEKKKILLTTAKPRATEQSQILSLQERLKKASFPTIDFRVVKHHVPKGKKR